MTTPDPLYETIRDTLAIQVEFIASKTIREEVEPEAIWSEAEDDWKRVMTNFRRMLAEHGAGDRGDIVAGKEQVFDV